MSKPVVLTAPRISSELHIGNYFGALLPMIDMAKTRSDDFQINLFVADLHGITTPIDYSNVQQILQGYLRTFAAAGMPMDKPDVYIYRQSYIPAHSELAWILDCFTGMGEMNRMTQFKDKSAKLKEDRISVGLFNYPVLMAADILLYGAQYVPVGEDQTQHLEFTRDIAERMNAQFGDLFIVPKPVKQQHDFFGKDQGLRIKDLVDPTKKMSKSDETGRGVIFLSDTPSEASKKIMSATTDSVGRVNLDFERQPGISNLLQISALLSNETLDSVSEKHKGQTSYGDLKKEVALQVEEFLTEFQSKLDAVDGDALMSKLESSEKAMNEQANARLFKVQKAVGLRQ